ncbi:BtrH N-terminal domain-containing protein [Dermatobacter hominis]|uniref:BtrH N-terminal domain-containing protein n=1 Tax=Dermatobacter hominis TaxID=2884263 RepID=UPI001D1224FE|nr:BtrH N-terminal domain-containing protein [Dermatobacter hominis]UDY35000.1 BtrH N-terminal domain-containing protein [Dermatobacter hominis]
MSFEDQIADLDAVGVVDTDGDGVADTVIADLDADGVADAAVHIDAATGGYSMQEVAADGSSVTLVHDADGSIVEAAFVDPTGAVVEMSGDGLADFLDGFGVGVQEDAPVDAPVDDGSAGTDDAVDDDVISQVPIQTDPDLYTTTDEVTSTDAYLEWEAGSGGSDDVVGDVSDADFWFQQSTGYTCAPSAATQIIEDFTGAALPNEVDVSVYAAELGLLSDDGMTIDGLAQVLTDLGVPSETLHDQTWDDLAGYLDEGRSVVMAVDSGDYWPGYADETDGVDHAVRIVAIDTERCVAVLSDSGHPDGHQLEVPLDALDEAWSSPSVDESGETVSDRTLVVSDQPDPTVDGDVADPYGEPMDQEVPDVAQVGAGSTADAGVDPFAASADADDDGGSPFGDAFSNPLGWVIVPVVLAASRIFSAVASKR